MAIQNNNTFLSKGDLKAYHEKILPYLGGNIAMSTNVATYYDENEKIIGSYNGKPLYQKTFTGTAPTCTTDGVEANVGSLPLGFRLDTLVDAESIITNTVGITRPLPNLKFQDNKLKLVRYWIYTDSAEDTAQRNTYGFVNSWTQENGGIIKLTLRYTKVTDAANSAFVTPGAYDINFPNMWPSNKEIYFGNGVYGCRYTGTFTGVSSTLKTIVLDASWAGVTRNIWRVGGYVTRGTNNKCPFPWNNNSSSSGVVYAPYQHSTGLVVQAADTTSSIPYDVWFLYTK